MKLGNTMDNFKLSIQILEVNEESYLDFASALAKEKRYPEAIAEYSDILCKNPQSTPALLELSKLHLAIHQYEMALAYAKKALVLDSAFVEGYIQLGTTYLKQRQESLAQEAFDRALRLNPKSARAYYGLGMVQVSQGQPEGAKQNLSIAIDLEPELGTAYLSLASILRHEHKFEQAIELVKTLTSIVPEADYAYECLGELHLMQGKVAAAKTYYEQALALNPGSVKSQVGLGRALIQSNNLDSAIIIFKNLLPRGNTTLLTQGGVRVADNLADG